MSGSEIHAEVLDIAADDLHRARSALLDYVHAPEFKRLLSDIAAAQHERDFRSIAVLSRDRGEGKTFFVSVLALGYAAFLGRRVLILDSIAQNSVSALYLERLFHADSADAPALASRGSIDVMTSRELGDEESDSVHAGAPRLGGADFTIGDFIGRMHADYDLIVVDTCALSGSSVHTLDPIVVARQTDTAILVTSQATLHRDAVSEVGRELRRRSIALLGTVYNGRMAL